MKEIVQSAWWIVYYLDNNWSEQLHSEVAKQNHDTLIKMLHIF